MNPTRFHQVQNLTFAYDGSYVNIFENVSFQLDTDWKLDSPAETDVEKPPS